MLTYGDYNQWLDNTVEKVIERLQTRIETHRSNPMGGSSAPDIEQQNKKFAHVEHLIDEHRENKKNHNKRSSFLTRTIRGYLTEFIRQSEENTPAINIENGRNPDAKRYWDALEETSPGSFKRAIFSGQLHTAIAYNKQLSEAHRASAAKMRKRVNKAPLFHSIGEIIRSTLDVFKEEYKHLHPDGVAMPSLHNDHLAAIELAFELRAMQSSAQCEVVRS